jgi:hypothetical protein
LTRPPRKTRVRLSPDARTLDRVKAAIDACLRASDERGFHRPFALPLGVAYIIIKAIDELLSC